MTFKLLFFTLCAVALRTKYSIDLAWLWVVATYGHGFRRWRSDLFLVAAFACLLYAAPLYMDWRYWYPLQAPPMLEDSAEVLRRMLNNAVSSRSTGPLERFLKAVLLGDKQGISTVDAKAFQKWGISHLLAVSGFHVGLWVGASTLLFRGVLRMAWMRLPVLFVQSAFLVVYALSVGAGPSVVRAVGTFVAVRWASARKATFHAMHWPFAVGVVAWLWQPTVAQELGFQLSYLAVLAILWSLGSHEVAQFFNDYDFTSKKSVRWLSSWIVPAQVSMAAWAATLPLVQSTFGGASPWFLVGNLLLVPVYVAFIWSALLFLTVPWVPCGWIDGWNACFAQWHALVVKSAFLCVNFDGFAV